MKAVAIVTNSLSGGGAERAMNLLAAELGKAPELSVLLIPINAGPRDLVEPGCEISEINRVWNGGLWDSLNAFFRFQYVIFKFKPKFLLLNCDLPEFYSAFAVWSAKCVIVEHTTRPWAGRKSFGNLIRLILRVRGAICVRVSDRIDVSPHFKNAEVIPNIIEPKIFVCFSNQRDDSHSQGKLLYIGRVSREKRPDLFIELARTTGIEAVIIGDGRLRLSLERDSKDILNLKFLGQQLNPWEIASKRDLLVLTSDYEGDGLVALEAISMGIPVVLRKTSDLLKIGFPQRSYFEDIPALATRLATSNFMEFELAGSERRQILKGRNPGEVSRLWLNLLLSLK
jgi:glycosyltransferase involved in cell wall biosynthesis